MNHDGRGGPDDHDPDPVIEATPAELEVLTLAGRFREFAEQAVARLPLYRRLCEGAASDLFVAARLQLAAPDQRTPNLLLAAVHDVLLAGEPDPLADWYPSVQGLRGSVLHRARPVGSGADDPWPHFQRLALDHDGVAERLRTRSVQTNEVGRALTTMPALFQAGYHAASGPPGGVRPLAIVEIGASAGLNLRLGAYGYRYHLPPDEAGAGGSREVIESVGGAARLVLDCELRGDRRPPIPQGALPIATAVGLDLHPLQVSRPADARWLLACQWPEETERLERLEAAIELARAEPPTVEVGDAVDDVARHLLAAPPHALPVVVSTWVLSYLSVLRQRQFLDVMNEVGGQRDVALVFAEQPERVPGLPVPPRPDGVPDGRPTALVRMAWQRGERVEVRLADQHPHGTWLEWVDRTPM